MKHQMNNPKYFLFTCLDQYLTVTIRLGFPQPESSNYALSALNESKSEELPQGPPLKFDSASFGGISQKRK